MDLASTQGFANAIWAVANLRPGAGHLTAPVCSTFVIVYFGALGFRISLAKHTRTEPRYI